MFVNPVDYFFLEGVLDRAYHVFVLLQLLSFFYLHCLPLIVSSTDSHIHFHFCKKMVNGGVVNYWACINFSRGVQETAAARFCQELAVMCQVSGMVISTQ